MNGAAMNRVTLITALFVSLRCWGEAQSTLTGSFPHLAHQQVQLVGFAGFKTYPIASATVAADGRFELTYAETDFGMGYLVAEDNRPFVVVLSGEDIYLTGEMLALPETIEVLNGEDNRLFAQYATEHPQRDQALSAWIFLRSMYRERPLFAAQGAALQAIDEEIARLQTEDARFIDNLNAGTYLRWYLPLRKLISSVATLAQFRTDEIPAAIEAFRALDHTDHRLYKSGLYKEALESHFWLIENSGRSLDEVFEEMKRSIDHLLETLVTDETKLNEIAAYLFELLERHSLFAASEHLALTVLEEPCCSLDRDLSRQLEAYRAMKTGAIAADFPGGHPNSPTHGHLKIPHLVSSSEALS